jgi:extradiol dioxygenase family protein
MIGLIGISEKANDTSSDVDFFGHQEYRHVNTTPHNFNVITILPHLMQNFLGIKNTLVM